MSDGSQLEGVFRNRTQLHPGLATLSLLPTVQWFSSILLSLTAAPSAILQAQLVAGLTAAAPQSAEFTRVTTALTSVVGVVLLVLAFFRFGFVTSLLSWPTMSGFASGAALVILASQLPDLLGLAVPKEEAFYRRIFVAAQNIGTARWRTIIISFVCILVLRFAKLIKIRGRSLPPKTPLPLFLVALFVLLSWALDFRDLGIKTVGPIPATLPAPSLPPLASGAEFVSMIPAALVLGLINYVQTISVELVFGKKVGEQINPTTELVALGAMSLGGSCFQCHAVCGGFTRTALQHQAGAKTPAAIALTGLFVLVATLALTPILRYLPTPVLASIIAVAASQLVNVADAKVMWQSSAADFLQLLATVIGVLALGIDKGILVGIGVSLVQLLYRSFAPRLTELGRLPGTETWVARYRYPQAACEPGVLVLRLDGELHFGNMAPLMQRLSTALKQAQLAADARRAGNAVSTVAAVPEAAVTVTVASGGRRAKETAGDEEVAVPSDLSAATEQKADIKVGAEDAPVDVAGIGTNVAGVYRHRSAAAAVTQAASSAPCTPPSHQSLHSPSTRAANILSRTVYVRRSSAVHSTITTLHSVVSGIPAAPVAGAPEFASTGGSELQLQHHDHNDAHWHVAQRDVLRGVVVDGSRIVHIDGTAALELKALSAAYRKAGVPLLFACLPGPVRDRLEAYRVDELPAPPAASLPVQPTSAAAASTEPASNGQPAAVPLAAVGLLPRDRFMLTWLTVDGAVAAIASQTTT